LAVLSTFITGDEPRTQFAISLTAEQIFRAHNFQPTQIEAWVQRPQIEIQPTTGASLSERVMMINQRIQWFCGRAGVDKSNSTDRNVQSKKRNG